MTGQIENLRSDMTGQIDSLRSETNARIDALSKELRITFIAGFTLIIGAISVATAIIALLIR